MIETTIAPDATASMATWRLDFYTIVRSGGPRNKRQVLVALRPMRREVRQKEWQVGWVLDRWCEDGWRASGLLLTWIDDAGGTTMLTRALADEYARRLDRQERRLDELRRDLDDVARELKRRPDKAEEAELADALRRSLDAEDAENEQARRELAAARAGAGI